MSRFTSAYHPHKPSAQQLPDRQSFTAPANLNTIIPSPTNDLGLSANPFGSFNPSGHSNNLSFSGLTPLAALSETPTRLQTRATTSVLGYNQLGREHTRHRVSRWLVLVFPPALVTQSRGMFGATLSSAPSFRLPQGLLIPLYPTVNQSVRTINGRALLNGGSRCPPSWARSRGNLISRASWGSLCICMSTKLAYPSPLG